MKSILTIHQTSTSMPMGSTINNASSNRKSIEISEDYLQVRLYFKWRFCFFLSEWRSNSRLSLHFVILAFFSDLKTAFFYFSLLLITDIQEEKKGEWIYALNLMNCVRRVCEQDNKQKCICICKMGCGSTRVALEDEKNVSASVFFL